MPVFDWMKTDMNYVPAGWFTDDGLPKKSGIDKSLEEVVKEVLDNANGFALPDGSPSGWRKCRSCSPVIAVSMILSCGKICFISSEKLSRCARKWGENGDSPGRSAVLIFWPPRVVKNRDDRRRFVMPWIHRRMASRCAPGQLRKIRIITSMKFLPNSRVVSASILPMCAILS